MRILRRHISVIAIAVILFAAVAMGATPAPSIRANPVEITFWSIFPEGDPKEPAMKSVIAEFERKNPDIKVNHLGTNFWDYFGKLSTAQAGKTDPDVSFNDIFSVRVRAKNGVIRSLTPFASELDLTQFRESDIETFTYNDELYALAFSSDYRVLYYNKEHFRAAGLDPDKPPATIKELTEYAEKLDVWSNQTDKSGDLLRVGFHPKLGNNQFYTDVWNNGGAFFKEGMPNFTDEKVIVGIQQYVDLCQRYPTRKFNGFYTQAQATSIDPFITQMCSMEVNGDWLAWEIEEYIRQDLAANPDKTVSDYDFEWSVAPYPYTDDNRTAYGGGFSIEMSSRTKGEKAAAAYRFIEFLTSYELQTRWIELFRFTPTNMNALENLKHEAAASGEQNKLNIFDEAQFKRSPDICEAVPEWWTYVTTELDGAVTGKVTVETAMKRADANLRDKINAFLGNALEGAVDVFMVVALVVLGAATVLVCVFVRKKEG